MRVLSFGSDPGALSGPSHPTYRRHMDYASRLEWLGMVTYSPPGHRPVMDRDVPLSVFPSNSPSKYTYPLDALSLGARLIKQYGIQVLVAQDPFVFGAVACLLSRWFRIPYAVHFHGDFFEHEYWRKERAMNHFLYHLGHIIARRASVIRTVSTKIRNDLLERGFDPTRVFYASPPVRPDDHEDCEVRELDEVRERLGLRKDRVFVFIGRLSPEKNLALLFQAIAVLKTRYPEVRLLVAGDGPERERLQKMREELAIEKQVVFLGKVPNREIARYLGVSLALILTSFYEGTAKVIKEAAFAGRATVTTFTSGVTDAILDGTTGIVVPNGDLRGLVQAMMSLLDHPEKAVEMGVRAREFVRERFVYERDIDRVVDVWRQALK
ncbi:MAG: glycosyltransferase family 4 protein [Deltaproteobacteria bacterium]|nr:glycosyltransferase family 4 protein [Deltaproteobacteria bacterium]